MVDAQVPGVAGRLRDLNRRPIGSRTGARAGGAWLGRHARRVRALHLLSRAWTRTDLPEALRATVRSHIGFTVPKETVLATAPVADTWAVVGMRDSDEEQVSTRRVWLYGTETSRYALVLFFAQRGMPLERRWCRGPARKRPTCTSIPAAPRSVRSSATPTTSTNGSGSRSTGPPLPRRSPRGAACWPRTLARLVPDG